MPKLSGLFVLTWTLNLTFVSQRLMKLVDFIEYGPYHFDPIRFPVKRQAASLLIERFADHQRELKRAEQARALLKEWKEWGKSLKLGLGDSDS